MTPIATMSSHRPDLFDGCRPAHHRFRARSRCGLLSAPIFRRLAVLVGLAFSLLGCAGMAAPPHIGSTARPENRLPLASLSEGETTWPAKDLNIHYKAVLAGDLLEISGFIEFSPNLAKFPIVDYFRVYHHFIDAEGLVIDSNLLWSTGVRTESRFVRWTFQRQWPALPAAVSMGFSYEGGASEAGGRNKFGTAKTGWPVQQRP